MTNLSRRDALKLSLLTGACLLYAMETFHGSGPPIAFGRGGGQPRRDPCRSVS